MHHGLMFVNIMDPGEDQLRDIIEASLDAHDITPLLKIVFQGGVAPKDLLPAPSDDGTASGAETPRQASQLETVLDTLQSVYDEKEAEVQAICQ